MIPVHLLPVKHNGLKGILLSAFCVLRNETQCSLPCNLKGLGHAILGNFSSDRMVIELTKISK